MCQGDGIPLRVFLVETLRPIVAGVWNGSGLCAVAAGAARKHARMFDPIARADERKAKPAGRAFRFKVTGLARAPLRP
jgi:hypothetical protein